MTLLANHVRPEVTIRTLLIPILTDSSRKIEHESYWNDVMLTRERDEWSPRFRLHVRSVDDCKLARGETLAGDEVQYFERVFGCGLIVLIIRHECAAKIRRNYFRRLEVIQSKRRLPATRRAN